MVVFKSTELVYRFRLIIVYLLNRWKKRKITIIGSDFQHYQQLVIWPKEVEVVYEKMLLLVEEQDN
jgi:hypothetical protein